MPYSHAICTKKELLVIIIQINVIYRYFTADVDGDLVIIRSCASKTEMDTFHPLGNTIR